MIGNISWFEYLTFISATALTWYGAVFYIYYRHDLLNSLQTKKVDPTGDEQFNLNFQQEHTPGVKFKNSQDSPDVSQFIQSFSDEVIAYLEEAAKNKVLKEEVLISLGKIANKFPSLGPSEFKESLDQFIVNHTETYCAMFLSEEDLNKVWGES